ncbi:hypothetical protein Rrhod_1879 [Rhodococcus rhodnii LMG 5362]|uniref:Uncharacterized protein n=1 Tax=Rhodococcus rhodnii LMG 5362 TaxID=1273125 RepID=R7WS40_9NOCA|nr:hypothetical protein Rrhod_1879 [Rhodococcus rhodnii LMG 5362]
MAVVVSDSWRSWRVMRSRRRAGVLRQYLVALAS